MTQMPDRDDVSVRINRRAVLGAGCAAVALSAGTVGRMSMAVAQAARDPLAPLPVPPQFPARDGIAQLEIGRAHV